jgi:hypothetical protein
MAYLGLLSTPKWIRGEEYVSGARSPAVLYGEERTITYLAFSRLQRIRGEECISGARVLEVTSASHAPESLHSTKDRHQINL